MYNKNKNIPNTSKNYINSKPIKLIMIKSINFSLNSINNNQRNFFNSNKANSYNLGVSYFNNALNHFIFKRKIYFYINLLSLDYDIKDNINYNNIRKLLSNILLKKLLTKKCNKLKYFFLKYHSKTFSLFISNNKIYNYVNKQTDKSELVKLKKINILQEQKISKFKDLIENYEAKNENQILEQDKLIKKFNSQIENVKKNYEEILSKNNNEYAQELIKFSNENLSKRQIITKLNKQIEEQRNLIKSLNEKIIIIQDNGRAKETQFNQKIGSIKMQSNNFQNIINDLNKKLEELKIEKDEYKNKNNELIDIEEKFININKENEILKNRNENINNKYVALRKDYVKMKVDFENNKKEFEKAIKEMDTYSQLLVALESKMNKAEKDKIKAELERDKAVQEIREIRQRYINIMSNNV